MYQMACAWWFHEFIHSERRDAMAIRTEKRPIIERVLGCSGGKTSELKGA